MPLVQPQGSMSVFRALVLFVRAGVRVLFAGAKILFVYVLYFLC